MRANSKWFGCALALLVAACGGDGAQQGDLSSAHDGGGEPGSGDPSWMANAHVTMSADKTDGVVADGEQAITLTLTVADAAGKLRAGITPVFEVTGSDNAVSAPAPTDDFGATQITLRSTKADTKTVAVSLAQQGVVAIERPQLQLAFVAGPAEAERSQVDVTPKTALANGKNPITFNVTLRDAHDNPVVGSPVMLVAASRIVGADITSEIGTASPSMTSASPQTAFVEVRTAGSRFIGSAEVTFE